MPPNHYVASSTPSHPRRPGHQRDLRLGPDTVSALLVAICDNPDGRRFESGFARLCGVAPIPASSGKTNQQRLHRGGDRSGNRVLHIAVIVRLR
ncbi:MAG: transposase [Actinomycetota bacterium]|nr:transposase [Actinomycetota bacterium]